MKELNLKELIGKDAYWTINKTLAKKIGLEATLMLQHLIDLEENYFKGDFWQSSTSLEASTYMSKHLVSKAIKTLSDNKLITVINKVPKGSHIISKRRHFEIHKDVIYSLFSYQSKPLTDSGQNSLPTEVKTVNHVDKEKNNKENNNKENILDVPSVDDIKGKIFFKIVELYPKNRIGNRQHGLKKFKKLDMEQCKLSALNLKRYLKVAGTYVKSLQNYIDHECYTEEWLQAEETKFNKKDINNTKTFSGTYDDID